MSNLLRAGAMRAALLLQGHGRRQSQHGGFLRLMEQTRMGLAGYDPDEDDMRGIFMAKGPGMGSLFISAFS